MKTKSVKIHGNGKAGTIWVWSGMLCYVILKEKCNGNVDMLHSTARRSVFCDASTVEMFESLDGQTEAER